MGRNSVSIGPVAGWPVTAGPTLVVTHGVGRGQVIEMRSADVIIGRGEDSDVVLESPGVSRRHVRLTREPSGTWIRDLRTIGGTTVNGTRLRGPVLLDEGDEVSLGGVTMIYHEAPEEVAETAG